MPATLEKHVCTYDELSDRCKSTARDWMREGEAEDFSQDDSIYEPTRTAAGILGIEFDESRRGNGNPAICWSGFSSQGDGLSFAGSYSHSPNSPAKIRSEFPTDTALHAIADGLDAIQNGYKLLTGHRLTARITQDSNQYMHSRTMSVSVEDHEAEFGDEEIDIQVDAKILELMRKFADWIYRGLEAEYDYRLSDENIDERIGDGEYEFDENGKHV